ncbi:hypothetical protein [Draconibacterium orientale]|jgi:PBP1b-binding outer membrane lipoprotein LpoB|uniref:hypothetical protein n=1 Tax=Draconibacterium orientale TaxID=1168034 RepID=UPI002A0A2DE5|nr:hypothetical protein [Draconibacterium orientale]
MKENVNTNKENIDKKPTHAYILWKTGEVIGFNMKEAALTMGIGSTAFKTNLRNRYVCKLNLTELTAKLKTSQDNECLTCINSENYDCSKNCKTIKQ